MWFHWHRGNLLPIDWCTSQPPILHTPRIFTDISYRHCFCWKVPPRRGRALFGMLCCRWFQSWRLKAAPARSYADHLHVESLIPENGDQSRQVSDERTLPPSTGAKLWRHVRHFRRRRCSCCRRSPVWLHCAGLVIVLTVVLSVDQEQQRRARIVEQGLGVSYSGTTGEESVRWLNMVLSAVWTPLQKTISGLGEELATLATFTLSAQEQDALSIAFENVTLQRFKHVQSILSQIVLKDEGCSKKGETKWDRIEWKFNLYWPAARCIYIYI